MMNLVLAAVLAASMAEPEVARDFRPARNTRGNTNLLHVQPIDEASWIWLPGFRKSMAGMELYENARGLLENLPGWNFVDWANEWRVGVPPDGRAGEGVSAPANLLWLLAMQSAAVTERAFGNEEIAAYWDRKAAALKRSIVAAFWDGKTGLFADSEKKDQFSEHAQCLALLGDVVTGDAAEKLFARMVTCEKPRLAQCTVYFSYYLFETYFKFGRGDLFLKRLDLWRDYVKKGLTTTQEAPDGGKNGQSESRSDCHAWGAHPIWFMQTGLAGVRSDAPGFARVRVAPCPGGLKKLSVRHPHPKGWIEAELDFSGNVTKGTVNAPVPGVFVCPITGRSCDLMIGVNTLPW